MNGPAPKAQGIHVDTSKFDAAFKLYLAKTSKTMQEAINWKANDLMLTAASQTPKTKMTEAQFKAQKSSPKFIGFHAAQRYREAGGRASGKPFRQFWGEARDSLAKRRLGRGFMRSAFIKAAKKIPRSLKGIRISGSDAEALAMDHSGAHVTHSAVEAVKSLAMDLYWRARGEKDKADKQAMVSTAFAKAFPIQAAKMMEYVTGENKKNAKSVSA